MNDAPKETLTQLVGRYPSLHEDPRRCEALLRDLCGEHRGEISVLISALKDRVAADLLASHDSLPKEVLLARLTKRLQDDLKLAENAARWGVETWALALGIISDEECGEQPRERTRGKARGRSSGGSAPSQPVVRAPGPTALLPNVQCKYCHRQNGLEEVYCQGCEEPLCADEPCSRCGSRTPLKGLYCVSCGRPR